MTQGRNVRLDLTAKVIQLITALIVFFSTVIGLGKVLQGDVGWVTTLLLAVGIGSAWLGCLYIAFARTRPQFGTQGPSKYPRLLPFARSGLVIIPLLTVIGVSYYFFQQPQPPSKVILLVANFDGPDPQNYRVTETLLTNLTSALEVYHDVQVKPLGRTITALEGKFTAREEGKNGKATIVIWGWYGVTQKSVIVSSNFELLCELKCLPELQSETGQPQLKKPEELETFKLQFELAQGMTYLSLVTTGALRFATEDWDGAIARLDDALRQNVKPIPELEKQIYLMRGYAHQMKRNHELAIADYSKVISIDPNYADAYSNRGASYSLNNQSDQAIADFDKALGFVPKDATVFVNRGLTYANKGQMNQAINDLNAAIELNPQFAGAYNNLGYVYEKIGQLDQSIASYGKAIETNPKYAIAYYNRGNSYRKKGDEYFSQAIADYSKAIEFDPKLAIAYHNRGYIYATMRQLDQAIADYSKAIELDHKLTLAYYSRALTYSNNGDKYRDQAISDFSQVTVVWRKFDRT